MASSLGFGREDQLLDDVARVLAATKPAVISIMHTSPNDTDEAIDIVRKHWKGPIGAYPESGYFKMPDWTFVDIIPPEELVAKSQEWRKQGRHRLWRLLRPRAGTHRRTGEGVQAMKTGSCLCGAREL